MISPRKVMGVFRRHIAGAPQRCVVRPGLTLSGQTISTLLIICKYALISIQVTALTQAATILKALANSERLRLTALLINVGELCVCELVHALQLPQYAVSRHLAILKNAGLVEDRRDGQWMYYGPAPGPDDFYHHLMTAVSSLVCQEDVERARARLAARRDGRCVVGYRDDSL